MRACAALLLVACATSTARAQDATRRNATPLATIGSFADERLRLRQLSGDTTLAGHLLRSISSAPRLVPDSAPRRLAWTLELPERRFVYNSDLPFSLNDGALWAARGASLSVTGGARVEWGPLRIFLLPEVSFYENREFAFPIHDRRVVPPLPSSRNPFSSPWHAGGQSIDLPLAFGRAPASRLTFGQSALIVERGAVAVGAATENEWWGPGIRNALILSNNAPGFPHAFLRTARPVGTRVGSFEARWLSGWLEESRFFDTVSTNQTRSISMMALTWQPKWTSGIVLGAARSVFAVAGDHGDAMGDAFNVFADVGQPNARPVTDSTITPGRDQLLSLFFRWVHPNDRFEFYGEWGRAEFPVSLRDFLVQPNHTQAYTLGLQWLGDTLGAMRFTPWMRDARLRAQGEVSFLEQSTTFRTRPIGSWYASRAVEQGYTNQGQMLGAAIGPGSSSQFVALDLVAPAWQAGLYVNRIRWLEDAHSQLNYDFDAHTRGSCEHDVSFLPGIRAAAVTRAGTLQADYSSGWRLNVFFEHHNPCFALSQDGPTRDVRNKSLTLTFFPNMSF